MLSYTGLRLGLLLLVWLTLLLLTPLTPLVAALAAVLISGAISLFVLDRQRSAVGQVAAGFFGRINERIEASARAEDGYAEGLGNGQEGTEQQAVDKQ